MSFPGDELEQFYEEDAVVEEKWMILLETHNKGMDEYVPKLHYKIHYIQDWLNSKCEKAKEQREKAWNNWRKRKIRESDKNILLRGKHKDTQRREEELLKGCN